MESARAVKTFFGAASSFETHRFAMLLRTKPENVALMVRSAAKRRASNHVAAAAITYPATCLMRAISSTTALSTGTFSLTTRFIALAQTFSLFRIVNL